MEFFGVLKAAEDKTWTSIIVGLPRDGWFRAPAAVYRCLILYSTNSTQGMPKDSGNTGYSMKEDVS
jgi:hypothetical protein